MYRLFRFLSLTIVLFLLLTSFKDPTNCVKKQPRNIILLIGDGMGVTHIYAALTVNKGFLNLERFPITGFSKTYSSDNYITDSGAGATAIACGTKTNNKMIGVDTAGNPMKSILEYAEENGLSTGLVATSSITHATPASFIAHSLSRTLDEDIALDFLKIDVDVFIGGGSSFFNKRKDGLNLIDSLRKRNYQVLFSMKDIDTVKSGKLAGLTAEIHNPRYSKGRGDMLVNATKKAISILNNNTQGFFLMVEGSMIDWAGHENNIQYVIEEVNDFDRTVAAALDFAIADGNTLVIVTADHETGGLALTGGDIDKGKTKTHFTSKDHTACMVPVFAYGPGAEAFSGIYQNTAIFDKMMELYGFSSKQ
jgi:alkaline phosphatase